MSNRKNPRRRITSKRIDRILAVIAIATIVAAWFVGSRQSNANLEAYLKQALPTAVAFDPLTKERYAAYGDSDQENLVGYVTIGTAGGYGGPMGVAVADRKSVV